MATKKIGALPDKKLAKVITNGTGKKNQRYVRNDNVENMKSKGYKVVSTLGDKTKRMLGIKQLSPEMTLMEK